MTIHIVKHSNNNMDIEEDYLWVQKRSKLKHERCENIIKWVIRLICGQKRLLFSIFSTFYKLNLL